MFLATISQAGKRAALIPAHPPRVAHNICRKDGRQVAVQPARRSQNASPTASRSGTDRKRAAPDGATMRNAVEIVSLSGVSGGIGFSPQPQRLYCLKLSGVHMVSSRLFSTFRRTPMMSAGVRDRRGCRQLRLLRRTQ